jgi:TPR repeat protein
MNVEVAFATIARDVMLRFALPNGAPYRSASALTDAIGAALGGEFVAELMAQSLYCLASQNSVQRWEAMFPCRALSQAFVQQWHVYGTDVGLKQRSTLLARAAFCELLVLRLMRLRGAYHVRYPLHHATCVVSRRHFFFSKNWTDRRLQEGQQWNEQQRFSDIKSWGHAALLQHSASHAFLSDMLYAGRQDVPMALKLAADTVLLECVFQAKRLTLSFLWNTRRFALCADCTLRRYDGEQLRHSAAITSTTSVAKVGDADFTVTFLQPDLRYHIRAASSAERDRWVSALFDAKTKNIFNTNCAHDQSTSTPRPVASLSIPPACAAMDCTLFCTHRKSALGRCLIAGEVARWFRLAAIPGHAEAQFNLGCMFENGQGVAQDRAEAARWYHMAAAQGHAVAAEALRQLCA